MDEGERVKLLELKARCSDLPRVRAWLDANAVVVGTFRQVDTYFRVSRGRLKVRQTDDNPEGTLIFYRREDLPGPKKSEVLLLQLNDVDDVRSILTEALGTLVTVEKVRSVYRWKAVQVHLDEVKGLGGFVEFERKVEAEDEEKEALGEFSSLRASLGIKEEDLVAGSYSDLPLTERPPDG